MSIIYLEILMICKNSLRALFFRNNELEKYTIIPTNISIISNTNTPIFNLLIKNTAMHIKIVDIKVGTKSLIDEITLYPVAFLVSYVINRTTINWIIDNAAVITIIEALK